jgi:hypothetical protein
MHLGFMAASFRRLYHPGVTDPVTPWGNFSFLAGRDTPFLWIGSAMLATQKKGAGDLLGKLQMGKGIGRNAEGGFFRTAFLLKNP